MNTVQLLKSRSLSALFLVALMALGGCGANESSPEMTSDSKSVSAGSSSVAQSANTDKETAKSAAPAAATAQLVKAASAVPRKIIYNATVDLISDNFSSAQRNLLALIRAHGGYIAETNIGGTPGTPRQGVWKIRVPETRFEAFMNSVVKLGELQTTHTDSQDVTAEFYDLQAHISNKLVEEKRLIALLQHATAKLTDILQVEKELSRVRGEIEELQGRLRLLANLTSLTTITVTLHEVKGYVAPKPTTFADQIARTFRASLEQLRDFGKGTILLIVAIMPLLIVLALIGVPFWLAKRRKTP